MLGWRTTAHSRVGREDELAALGEVVADGSPSRRRGDANVPTGHTGMLGSPPRRRGGLPGRDGRLLAGRLTPASAGRTRWRRSPRCTSARLTPASAGRTASRTSRVCDSAAHPRVGGEDPPGYPAAMCRGGTPPRRQGGRGQLTHHTTDGGAPPRRRGGQPERDGAQAADRHTPASVGRTCPPRGSRPVGSAHPRVGGEDNSLCRRALLHTGTPPRRRGGHRARQVVRAVAGHTPASAGRTPGRSRLRRRRAAHPRVGGEDIREELTAIAGAGTPPRRRGGPGDLVPHGHDARHTPASAGRTLHQPEITPLFPAHPRVGGEDGQFLLGADAGVGTSPRRRGGRRDHRGGTPRARLTLASAGKTSSYSTSRNGPGRAAHPRRRGGQAPGPDTALRRRLTPASEWRTGSSGSPPSSTTAHPRVGGEDGGTAWGRYRVNGTPPRRRGRPEPTRRPRDTRRLTPASAGRTRLRPSCTGSTTAHPRVGGED